MPEPQFLLPGAVPVVAGTALGWALSGSVDVLRGLLALFSIVFLNAGSNMINDYYDHLSGNDWLNDNPNPFGGGSRYIQNNIVTPGQMKLAGLGSLALGGLLGLAILYLTQSGFILLLGAAGLLGGYFWTAPPVRFCYRFIGEPYIFTLFGPLPVLGACYLQTGQVRWEALVPGAVIGFVIAMVAEINSFPDREADAAADKKTFVVRYGPKAGVLFYRIAIGVSFLAAASGIFFGGALMWGGVAYLLLIPMGIVAMRWANVTDLTELGKCRANILTIALHSAGGIALSIGYILNHFLSK